MTPRPTVLLHGFTGHADCWDDVIALLPPSFGARAMTLHGHAFEQRRFAPVTFEEEVDRVAGLIEREACGRVRICGYSMGGRVALHLLTRHPQLFSSAVLIGASPGLQSESERAERAVADAKWRDLAVRHGERAFATAWQAQAMFASQSRLPEHVRERQHGRRIRHSADGLARALTDLGLASMPNLWPELSKISAPVHLVVGELDTKFHAVASRMLPLLQRGVITVVPDVGHNVVLEAPARIATILGELPE